MDLASKFYLQIDGHDRSSDVVREADTCSSRDFTYCTRERIWNVPSGTSGVHTRQALSSL